MYPKTFIPILSTRNPEPISHTQLGFPFLFLLKNTILISGLHRCDNFHIITAENQQIIQAEVCRLPKTTLTKK